MKKAAVITCTLLFVAVAGLAETKSPPPLSAQALAAILGPPAVKGSCPTSPQSEVLFAARPAVPKICNASADCGSDPPVSCSYEGAGGSCSFAHRNCDIGEQGHVTCQGVTTWCPEDCCTGTPKCVQCCQTGDCFACCRCDGGTIGQCLFQCGGA